MPGIGLRWPKITTALDRHMCRLTSETRINGLDFMAGMMTMLPARAIARMNVAIASVTTVRI